MKHLLNDLSPEEKNNILKQHTGGKQIDTSRFKTLSESKSGDVKPILNGNIKTISKGNISESDMKIDPFTLSATSKGNLKITNNETNLSHIYSMKAWSALMWWDCKIKDFPGGTNIKLVAGGQDKNLEIDKPQMKQILTSYFGDSVIQKVLKGEDSSQEVKFTKMV
jgi:hypothetical protein